MRKGASIWRFLNTGFGDAFFNMALDEALVESVRQGLSPPTFRVYGWRPPAVSFGYTQRIEHEVDVDRCRAMGVDVVRRPTGGRAVLHWEELTYSVVCRADEVSPASDPLSSISSVYHTISRCLVEGLRLLGVDARLERSGPPPPPFHLPLLPLSPSPRWGEGEKGRRGGKRGEEGLTAPCFSSAARHEVTIGGRKLIGSAQRRLGEMLLQHGSLLMGPAHKGIVDLMRTERDGLRQAIRRELEEGTTSLEEVLSHPVGFDELEEALRRGLERCLGVEAAPGAVSPWERERTEALVSEKYGTATWNLGR